MKRAESNESVGSISSGVLYTAAEVQRRLLLGTWSWRQVRRQGLIVHRVGGRAYVLGDDLIAFFKNRRTDKDTAEPRAEQ